MHKRGDKKLKRENVVGKRQLSVDPASKVLIDDFLFQDPSGQFAPPGGFWKYRPDHGRTKQPGHFTNEEVDPGALDAEDPEPEPADEEAPAEDPEDADEEVSIESDRQLSRAVEVLKSWTYFEQLRRGRETSLPAAETELLP